MTGAVVSAAAAPTVTVTVFGVSTLPATSVERYSIAYVPLAVKAGLLAAL